MITATHPRSATAVDVVELLTAMLAVPSVSGNEGLLAEMLVTRLDAAGFDAELDDAGNVIAGWGSGPETLALVGHLDTVAGHIDVRRDGGMLHGRGAVDAKGPLSAAIAAVSRQPRDAGRRFVVVGAVEEESTSRGARFLATSMQAPEGLIILEPSGWDAVTIGYKGSLRMHMAVSQPQTHGAGRAPSASDRCVDLVRVLQDFANATNGEAGVFDRIDMRVLRLHSETDGLVDTAEVDIGIRTPPVCDIDALVGLARSHTGVAVTVSGGDPGVRTDRNSRLARACIRAIRDAGGAPRFKVKTGTSDMNILVPAWGCPALAYGPGDATLDHTPHECVSVAELERAVDVLDVALRET
ncbi:MAG: [LysW]-lysine hydrolase [Candidatus Dormiibacterota bacterium]